jgi:NitT/TauT family transport system substrate-binding protein
MAARRGVSTAVLAVAIIVAIAGASGITYLVTPPRVQPTTTTVTQSAPAVTTTITTGITPTTATITTTEFVTTTITTTPTEPPPPQLTKVKFHLAWFVSESDAGYFAALDQGFYRDEGLDVEITPSGFTTPGIQLTLVASGEYQFGLAQAQEVVSIAAGGADVVALSMMYQNDPSVFYSLPSNPVRTAKDLEGKRVGIIPFLAEYGFYRAMLGDQGVDVSKVSEVTVSFDVVTPLLTGEVDVVRGWRQDYFAFVAAERPDVVQWAWGECCTVNPYSSGVFTNRQFLEQNPDLVRAFLRASDRGWRYVQENPGEAVDILRSHQPEPEAFLTQSQKLDIVLTYFLESDDTQAHGLGWMELARWQGIEEVLFEAGFITTHVDVSRIFTTDFLPGL